MTGEDDRATLRRLVAAEQVRACIQAYCRAADARDEVAFRACFHPDARCGLGEFEGDLDAFVARGFHFLGGCEETQHLVSNHEVELLADDRARATSYLLAYHRIAAGTPGSGAWSGHREGVEEVLWTGGRYEDELELREGAWRIARRRLVMGWEQWGPADRRSFLARDAS